MTIQVLMQGGKYCYRHFKRLILVRRSESEVVHCPWVPHICHRSYCCNPEVNKLVLQPLGAQKSAGNHCWFHGCPIPMKLVLTQGLSVVQTYVSLHCNLGINRFCLPPLSQSSMGSFPWKNLNHISNFRGKGVGGCNFLLLSLQYGRSGIQWWEGMLSVRTQ